MVSPNMPNRLPCSAGTGTVGHSGIWRRCGFGMMKAENGWIAIGGCARQKGFETIERYTGLETLELEERFEESNSAGLDDEQENDSLKRWESCRVAQKPVLLLECMSNLVLNEFYAQENGAQERILQGIKHLQNQCHDLIIVTNEIFSDGVTYDLESERYIELLGRINRELGQMADSVTEVVYGIPLAVSTPVFAADERTKDVG